MSTKEICKTIDRLLSANHRARETDGPSSDNARKNYNYQKWRERWEHVRRDIIVPNNSAIVQLIRDNKDIFPSAEWETICRFIHHSNSNEFGMLIKERLQSVEQLASK